MCTAKGIPFLNYIGEYMLYVALMLRQKTVILMTAIGTQAWVQYQTQHSFRIPRAACILRKCVIQEKENCVQKGALVKENIKVP